MNCEKFAYIAETFIYIKIFNEKCMSMFSKLCEKYSSVVDFLIFELHRHIYFNTNSFSNKNN